MAQPTSLGQTALFVGSYAAQAQPGIHAFSLDGATGDLEAGGSYAGIANPSFLAAHPSHPWLFAVSETSQAQDGVAGSVWALRFDPQSLALEPANHQPSGGDWPCHLQLDATGQWLVVSNYGSGSVGVLPIRADGSLGEMSDLVQHRGRGENPQRQEGPHAHSATFAPGNVFVLVADLGIDQLFVYRFDSSAGKLNLQASVRARPGAGPRHVVFHPSGRLLYVANELDSTVAVHAYDAAEGLLRELQIVDTVPPGTPENQVADIHISPAGDRVYVSNRGHDSIAVFGVESDGRLAGVAGPSCGGKWPRNFALAPAGQFVLVANQYSDEVSVLPVLAGEGGLGAVQTRAAVPQPACVQFATG